MALGALGGRALRADAAQSCMNAKCAHRAHTAGPGTAEEPVRKRQGAQVLRRREADDFLACLPLPLPTLKHQPTFAGPLLCARPWACANL